MTKKLTTKTPAEWAMLTRAEFLALAEKDAPSKELAEFATRTLYDSGFVARQAKGNR